MWSLSFRSFLSIAAIFSHLRQNIILRTVFFNTRSLCSCLTLTDQVWNP